MAKTPKIPKSPRPKKKPKRKHIPALSAEKLTLAIQDLQTLNISQAGKQQIEAMLRAAANPASESPDVVIATLPPERRDNIRRIEADLGVRFNGVAQRCAAALLEMDEAEFSRLVEEANAAD